jgi:Bacterial PH domain
MSITFAPARWPRYLKASSAIVTCLVAALVVFAWRILAALPGTAGAIGLAIAATITAVPIVGAWFMVSGYALEGQTLCVRRLVSTTRIPLEGLRAATYEPGACQGALRVFGNGGLYAFTGLYQNSHLGHFRLYGTDLSKSVVLVLPDQTVVVTPEQPQAFVEGIRPYITDSRAPERR